MDTGSEIRRGLEVLVAPGQVFEVRSWTGDRIASGYFDDLDTAGKAIEALDAANPDGIYLTPNPVLPDLLARRANRIKGPLAKKDSSTSDSDILSRRWFLIDIDPARPSGVSSSEEEHQTALDRADEIAAALGERGWPAPVAGDSGNGAHLLYRVDLPNDEQATALIRAALVGLDGLFSDAKASVDTAVYNASRIWKVYGTVARKGDNTRSRPHRRSRLLSVPDLIGIVTREQLPALAITDPAPAAPAPSGKGNGRRPGEKIDLAGWLRDHGLGVTDIRPYQGGDLYRLDACPFSSAHTDGAFAIQFASGAIHAGCHHASCGGGSQRWPELREMYEKPKPAATHEEKGAAYRKKKAAAREAVAGRDDAAPVETDGADAAVLAEARQILETGDPLAYMVDTFNLDHVGDEILGQCLALSLASRIVWNSKGLHTITTGESGKGKSDGYRAMLRQVPARFKLDGSFSDKSLYYKTDLSPLSVFFVDDKDMSDSLQEILKESTSSFTQPITHHTLTSDRKPLTCTIPERCVWWVAKKEGAGDDQVLNRMLTVWVNESDEQDRAVIGSAIDREARDDDRPAGEHREIAICRAMWEIIHHQMIDVNLSGFAKRIRFSNVKNRRNPLMFFDMIKSVAALRFLQRDRRDLPDGMIRVYATEADFHTATAIFAALHGVAGSQGEKLTKREADVLNIIVKAGLAEFTIQKVQALSKLSYFQVYRMMQGYASHGANYTGLLDKCPAISTLERSTSARDDNGEGTIRRRVVSYTFDAQVYRHWRTGGLVWLGEPEIGTDDQDPDPGEDGLHHLQHDCTTFAADVAKNKNEEMGATGGTDTVSSCVQDDRSLFAADLESTQTPLITEGARGLCVCDPAICCKQNEGLEECTGIDNLDSEPAQLVCGNLMQTDANVPQKISPAANNLDPTPARSAEGATNPEVTTAPPLTLAQVNPGDYSLIPGGPLVEPCPICGGPLVHYTERYQAQQARGAKERSRHICRGCYHRARAREQVAVQILPGAIPLNEVEPVDPGLVGRCSVCGLQAAGYLHASGGTAICSVCYEKLVREQVDIR
jgi:hypothetical protein